MGFVKKSGAWFEYQGNKIAQGRESAKEYLKSNPEVIEELLKAIKSAPKEEE